MLTKLAYRLDNELAIRRELYDFYLEVCRLINSKQRELRERVNRDQEHLEHADSKYQMNKIVEDMTTAATVHDEIEDDKRKIVTQLQKISDEIKALEEDDDDTNFLA